MSWKTVYVVMGWPKTGTQSDSLDVLGVWHSRNEFKKEEAEIADKFVIGWGYSMPVEGEAVE